MEAGTPMIPVGGKVTAEVRGPRCLVPGKGTLIQDPFSFATRGENVLAREMTGPSRWWKLREDEVWRSVILECGWVHDRWMFGNVIR